MAAFLAINGLTVPIAVNSFDETPREIGGMEAAYDGTARLSRQSTKHDCAFEMTPQASADALAWESLIRGLGQQWSFLSSLYGTKGLGPTAGYVATQTATGGKFAGRLTVTATTGAISYAAALGSNWAAMFWRFESAAWHHHIILSSGTKYLDGVVSVASTSYFAVASGTATITNVTGSDVDYSDLVLLPYLPISTWPATWGIAAAAFSSLPLLNVTGDAVPETTTRSMLGKVSKSELLPAVVAGASFKANVRRLSVELSEA